MVRGVSLVRGIRTCQNRLSVAWTTPVAQVRGNNWNGIVRWSTIQTRLSGDRSRRALRGLGGVPVRIERDRGVAYAPWVRRALLTGRHDDCTPFGVAWPEDTLALAVGLRRRRGTGRRSGVGCR